MKHNRIALALVIAASLLFHLLYFRHGVQNLVDLGVACVDSERILDGQVPGRDYFESYGPGRFYLIAIAFLLGGKSLLTLSTLCVILLAVKDALVFMTARCLLSLRWSLYVAALSIMVHGPVHKVFFTLACMLVLYPAFLFISRPNRRTAFVLGVGIFLAGMLRYDLGAIGLIMAVFLLIITQARRTLALGTLSGLALPGVPAALYFLLAGIDPGAMVENHLKRINSLHLANADMPGVLDLPFSGEPSEFLFGLLLIFLVLVMLWTAVTGIRIRKTNREQAILLAVLVLISLLLSNQVRLGVKFIRLSQISPPLFMAFAFLLQERILKFRWAGSVAAGAFFVFLASYIWAFQGFSSQDSFAVFRMREHYMADERARCWFKKKKGMEIEEVVRFLKQSVPEGEAIFTGPSCPLFHFLSGRPNPSPFTDFTFYYFDDENQKRVIEAVEEAKVRYVVHWPRPLTGFWFGNSAPLLHRYLETGFIKERNIGRFVILRRR